MGLTRDDVEHVPVVRRGRDLGRVLALDERLEHADRRAVHVPGQERHARVRLARVPLQLLDEPVALFLLKEGGG